MKTRIFWTAIACLFLAASLPAKAQPASVASLLSEAYADLDKADHDYKGHRIRAMKQLEAAGKVVNLNLGGDGKGHEKQGVSDEQVAAAQGVLSQIEGQLAGQKRNKVLRHVKKAQEELATALKVK